MQTVPTADRSAISRQGQLRRLKINSSLSLCGDDTANGPAIAAAAAADAADVVVV